MSLLDELDLSRYVFTCSLEDWQVQLSPQARSEFGDVEDAYYALCEAHRVHVMADHNPDEVAGMRDDLVAMGAPEVLTDHRDGLRVAYMNGELLPSWWTD